MELVFTTCGRCNPENRVSGTRKLTEQEVSLLARHGYSPRITEVEDGFCPVSADEAEFYGWQETEYGHICPLCINEELVADAQGVSTVGFEAFEASLILKKS